MAAHAPLAPLASETDRWNADLLAEAPDDAAGRGFRQTPAVLPTAGEAVQALVRAPLELGLAVKQGAHYARALLAAEIAALER